MAAHMALRDVVVRMQDERWAHAHANHAASHNDHEKCMVFLFLCMDNSPVSMGMGLRSVALQSAREHCQAFSLISHSVIIRSLLVAY